VTRLHVGAAPQQLRQILSIVGVQNLCAVDPITIAPQGPHDAGAAIHTVGGKAGLRAREIRTPVGGPAGDRGRAGRGYANGYRVEHAVGDPESLSRSAAAPVVEQAGVGAVLE